ncbi:RNA-binding protein 39-like isoform X2 [Paramacrobiotus metropolitanus]|uniref:RNA-binding protein 39-like isoform X2 n=1 Tax=Paramacrobiotus metropolitanus TaxID=2943436 RepID=UPI0024461722|nr:RNA-binding protein 39-like isoform X2 [Paramacrobiotus metropolitanus]
MSDAEDMKVDDMLEEVFKGNGKKDPSSGKMNGPYKQDRNASPEPQNGTAEKRAEESGRKRRPSKSPSRSRSRTPKPKKKRSRSKDKESRRSRNKDEESRSTRSRDKESRRRRSPSRERSDRRRDRDRRRSPSPPPSDADRDRKRSRKEVKERSVSKSRSRTPRRSPKRSRSRSPRRRDDRRDRERDRRSPVRRDRSRSPRRSPRRDRGEGRRYERSPPRYGGGRGGGRDRGGFGGRGGGGRARQSIERARSVRSESPDIPAEERDQRTVFCMQLAQTINAKDLEKFFSSVGRVRDVRLIVDSKTRRSKGISYVEFYELEAVPLALGLHGQKLKNCPMNIQPTHAEKNRAAMAAAGAVQKGPMRLYVGSLHFNITEDMLKDIFEPFGKLDSVQLMMDPESGRSRGYAFITFRDAQDAKRAMEQLNGFELAGRAMKIGHVTDRSDNATQGSLDYDDTDRAGFDLGPTGRLQLMAKLAEGTGMKIPQSAAPPPPAAPAAPAMAPIATQCFMLSNMFDPKTETESTWACDLKQEVIDECSQYGGVVHVHVDADAAEGNVYVKSVSIAAATLAVQSLHGRFFAGRMITVNYIPTLNYHQLFPDAMKSHFPLAPSQR